MGGKMELKKGYQIWGTVKRNSVAENQTARISNNVFKQILISHRFFFNNLWKQIKSNPINDYLLSYDHITQTFFNKKIAISYGI